MENEVAGIRGHLLALHTVSGNVINSAAREHGASLGRLLQLDLDIQAWEKRLSGRPEVIQLTSARRELGFAIYAASGGLYIHAYTGIRLFLELSFASVYFSANELHRRRWVSDREDFSWSRALDQNDGVLAAIFVSEFTTTAVADAAEQAKRAASAYRHCSQFTHGKLAVTGALPDKLSYSGPVLVDWISTATNSAIAVIYLLYARYGDELLPADEDGKLSATLESSFGHLVEVRRKLGLPIDEKVDR
jgi:hypothetical protein